MFDLEIEMDSMLAILIWLLIIKQCWITILDVSLMFLSISIFMMLTLTLQFWIVMFLAINRNSRDIKVTLVKTTFSTSVITIELDLIVTSVRNTVLKAVISKV
jgi:hypothetical protein